MELNKYQSLKEAVSIDTHILSLVSVVGQIVNDYKDDIHDDDKLVGLLGDILEHTTCIASLNNITLDTIAGLNVNSYQPDLHKVVSKGDTVTYKKEKYIVYDVIGNQLLIANQTKDIVVDIKDIGR